MVVNETRSRHRAVSRVAGMVKRLTPSSLVIESVFPFTMDFDLDQLRPEDRWEVDPPIQVEVAKWSAAGTLDWWVKEHRPRTELYGRVRGPDGKQRWVKAADLRPKA
jgi:hypothetical protein